MADKSKEPPSGADAKKDDKGDLKDAKDDAKAPKEDELVRK